VKPSQVIGPPGNPYLLRWILFRQGTKPRVYIHHFMRSDDDRALHDHPWWFVSILLRGSYLEHGPGGARVRRAPSIAFRPLDTRHRIELLRQPVWTLFITGPRVRGWGFWCEDRFVPWRDFDGCDR
jgi:hypothetical protein